VTLILKRARGGAVGWGTALQVWSSRVRLPVVLSKFFIDIILPYVLPGNKGGRCVRLTILPSTCDKCPEICESQPPGTFWVSNGPVQVLLCYFGWHLRVYWRSFHIHDELHHGEEIKVGVTKIQTCTCVPYFGRLSHSGVPFIVSPGTANFCAFAMIAPETRGSSRHDKRSTFYLSILSLP